MALGVELGLYSGLDAGLLKVELSVGLGEG